MGMTAEELLVTKSQLLEVLEGKEDLLLIKGQLVRPEPMEKKDHSGFYVVFELKVVKEDSSGSKYATQYNTYSVIVPSTDVKEMAPLVKEFKNCEVLAVIRPAARIRRGTNGGKFNSIDLYLERLFLLSELREKVGVPDILTDM